MARNPDNPRRKPTSAKELTQIAERLRVAADLLDGVAAGMQANKVKQVEVEGHKMVDRAFDQLGRFIGNCQKEVPQF